MKIQKTTNNGNKEATTICLRKTKPLFLQPSHDRVLSATQPHRLHHALSPSGPKQHQLSSQISQRQRIPFPKSTRQLSCLRQIFRHVAETIGVKNSKTHAIYHHISPHHQLSCHLTDGDEIQARGQIVDIDLL